MLEEFKIHPNTCVICLEDIDIYNTYVQLKCKHIFHKKCFSDMILNTIIDPILRTYINIDYHNDNKTEYELTCPICRKTIVKCDIQQITIVNDNVPSMNIFRYIVIFGFMLFIFFVIYNFIIS